MAKIMSLAAHACDIELRFVLKSRLFEPTVTPPIAKPLPPLPNPTAQPGKGKPAARNADIFGPRSARPTKRRLRNLIVERITCLFSKARSARLSTRLSTGAVGV